MNDTQIGKTYWFQDANGHYFKGQYIGNNQGITGDSPNEIIFQISEEPIV